MASKWQKKVTVASGESEILEIPGGVGKVRVFLDWAGTGTGSAQFSYAALSDAVADGGAAAWQNSSINATGADADVELSAQAVAVKLSAATTDQVFVLTGELNA